MNKDFVVGFVSGLLLFIVVNILVAQLASDCGIVPVTCADAIVRFGWPLQFYESGGFMYQQNFNSLYLLIDIGIGIGLATLGGWLFSHRKKPLPN